jgi:hypothetical protein
MTRRRRTTSTRWRREPARAACACSGATSSTAPRSSTPRGAARASSTSPPPAPLTASTTPRYSCLCSACRGSPPRQHAHTDLPLRSWLQKQLIVPAVQGTLNVLRAAKDAGGVRRVVLTSSVSSIVPSPGWPAGEVVDERCWTDIDYCEKNGVSLLANPAAVVPKLLSVAYCSAQYCANNDDACSLLCCYYYHLDFSSNFDCSRSFRTIR